MLQTRTRKLQNQSVFELDTFQIVEEVVVVAVEVVLDEEGEHLVEHKDSSVVEVEAVEQDAVVVGSVDILTVAGVVAVADNDIVVA